MPNLLLIDREHLSLSDEMALQASGWGCLMVAVYSHGVDVEDFVRKFEPKVLVLALNSYPHRVITQAIKDGVRVFVPGQTKEGPLWWRSVVETLIPWEVFWQKGQS